MEKIVALIRKNKAVAFNVLFGVIAGYAVATGQDVAGVKEAAETVNASSEQVLGAAIVFVNAVNTFCLIVKDLIAKAKAGSATIA